MGTKVSCRLSLDLSAAISDLRDAEKAWVGCPDNGAMKDVVSYYRMEVCRLRALFLEYGDMVEDSEFDCHCCDDDEIADEAVKDNETDDTFISGDEEEKYVELTRDSNGRFKKGGSRKRVRKDNDGE